MSSCRRWSDIASAGGSCVRQRKAEQSCQLMATMSTQPTMHCLQRNVVIPAHRVQAPFGLAQRAEAAYGAL